MRAWIIGLVLLGFLWVAPASASLEWPNEPAGSTVVLNCNWTDPLCGGFFAHSLGTLSAPYTFPTPTPLSPSGVYREERDMGSGSGINGIIYSPSGRINKNEIYIGFWFRAHIEGNTILGNKLFFTKSALANDLFALYGDAFGNSFDLIWDVNSPFNNNHIAGTNGKQLFPNVGTCKVSNDIWYRVEIYEKTGATTTSQDATIRWWLTPLNGTMRQCGEYTNVNFPGPVTNIQIDHTWYGYSFPSGQPQQLEDWFYYWDHIYVSYPNGGSIPPPDTTPPGTPQDFAVNP